MKIFKRILIASVILTSIIVLGVFWFLGSSKPVYSGELVLNGLHKDVQVHYDNYGIPHIYAENEHDLYFSLGYVHAQERLFQMELLRRVGGGNLAEIFGPELVETDRFMRTIGINETAKKSAAAYLSSDESPFQKAALAYLQGLNTYLKTGATPPEFTLLNIPKREFTPVDLYRIVGYIGFSFNTAIRTDPLITSIALKLGPDYINDLKLNTTKENFAIPTNIQDTSDIMAITTTALNVLESLPIPVWMGSNSWVVASEKTKSGYPMLANDTHIGFGQPAVFYEAHLSCPGFDFYGNHLAGFPFALIGHNDFSAWGLTIFPNDDMDFYREKANPNNYKQVWYQDHWEELNIRKEIIAIKGSDDLEFTVRSTRHGPIINEVNAIVDSLEHQPVSFFWTYNKFPNKVLQVAYGMAHSRSIDQFRSAVSLLEAPGLNITYADKDGNIAWWAVARLIKRPAHVESKMILNGSSGDDEPLGWYPFSENPRSENPDHGFVYSANNQPDSVYKVLHPGYYYPGARGKRITQLISENDQWDLEDFQEMVMDDKSPVYPAVAQTLGSLISGELSALEEKTLYYLTQWDGRHGLQDVGPTIFYRLIYHLQKNTMEDELGADQFQVYMTTMVARRSLSYLINNERSVWWDNIHTDEHETRDMILRLSLKDAVNDLAESLGNDPNSWTWDKVHLLEHVHAIGRKKPFNLLFNVGPFAVSGGDEVINKMDFDKTQSPYKVRSGAAMRILIDLADIKNSLSVLPTGQSGHLMSPHYQDQAGLYNSGKFRAQHMDKDKIIAQSKGVLFLKAGK